MKQTDGNMDYINSIMEKHPPFKTKEEEDEMIAKYLKKNDVQGLKNELVLRNVGLVRKYGKMWNGFYSSDEIASIGIEGLMKAVRTYDPNVGVRFSTYAGYAIRTMFHRKKETIRNAIDERSVSLDVLYEFSDSKETPIADLIDRKVRDEYRVVKPTEKCVGRNDTVAFVFSLLKDVGCSEREIRIFRKAIVEGDTFSSIGDGENISRERVRQMFNKVCSRIRMRLHNVSKRIINVERPKMEDFIKKETRWGLNGGNLVTKTYENGVDWTGYYNSIQNSDFQCFKKLREIIKDGIVS